METFDMVLPLMDDRTLTILEDSYVVKDGQVSVVAWPSRPYQYMIYVTTPSKRTVMQIYDHKSYVIKEEKVTSSQTFGNYRTLNDDDWKYEGLVLVQGVNQSVWTSTGGLPAGGGGKQEFDLLGASQVAPNKWKLHLDETNTTLYNIEGLAGAGDIVVQRTSINYLANLTDDMTVEQALSAVYKSYKVTEHIPNPGDPKTVPYVHPLLAKTHVITEETRQFFESQKPAECTPNEGESPPPIACYTIVEGTSSYDFFYADSAPPGRRLIKLNRFQYPTGCRADINTLQDPNVCLFIDIDAEPQKLGVELGLLLQDVNKPSSTGVLGLDIVLSWPGGKTLESLRFFGVTCATIWQVKTPAGVGLALNICFNGNATSTDQVAVTLTFTQLGSSGQKMTVAGVAKGTAQGGKMFASADSLVTAGAEDKSTDAAVSFDLNASSREDLITLWSFLSGFDFEVGRKILNWRMVYHWRVEQWGTGTIIL
ncbi:hypothetical protein Pmar_PMAR015932 [Perkinsus marinus ATCC 50983]|uniref:Uncharacterized protein n=1 Tax=Perkinsus marinus (strain ATCC 50983 / TXsc) TaxID=423536 RepID=C5L447_PERM5|nr:hypothetical protein Pmar_PMAR015932 [Perkinsus marinus ATCC 50983]EER08513.1 hypothetical protein Pmar_PMAR015932 [Perkinsus marinus ATCC 50983]|eukprot:XP_002776697.1 hypothetical protein Pmar_PMAR015932 [Perkinsus marinus ATCC 50983]